MSASAVVLLAVKVLVVSFGNEKWMGVLILRSFPKRPVKFMEFPGARILGNDFVKASTFPLLNIIYELGFRKLLGLNNTIIFYRFIFFIGSAVP